MILDWLAVLYGLSLAGLSIYGCLGWLTMALFWRHRHDRTPRPAPWPAGEWPRVTVQLPLFNEPQVVERLIAAAVALDYPADRLQIQVVDDSTDDTTARAARLVARFLQEGHDIQLIHRPHRGGYKAGALAAALPRARGRFLALFDADFLPPPDFLRRILPYFRGRPRLGILQARWGHLNAQTSGLTAAQAIAVDKHFAMEQLVRHRANYYPKFNGSATLMRRRCLEDAGGWQSDTVCEDLCLSIRAALRGWAFQFLPDVVAPAQLPSTVTAYKSQQARWARGSLQCLRKYGRQIMRDDRQPLVARLYAWMSMFAYSTNFFALALLLLMVPLVAADQPFSPNLVFLSLAGLGQPLLFILAQRHLHRDWRRRLRHFPTLLLLALGLSPTICRSLLAGLRRREAEFVRTPKPALDRAVTLDRKPGSKLASPERPAFDAIIAVELGLALYATAGSLLCLIRGAWGPLPFLLACAFGLGHVGVQSWRECDRGRRHGRRRGRRRGGRAADRRLTAPAKSAAD